MSSTREIYLRNYRDYALSYEDVERLYDRRYGLNMLDQYAQITGSTTNAMQTYTTTTRLPLSATISNEIAARIQEGLEGDYDELSTCTAKEIPSDGRYYYGHGAFSITDEYDIEIAADGSSIRLVSKERPIKEPDPTLTQDQQQKFLGLI